MLAGQQARHWRVLASETGRGLLLLAQVHLAWMLMLVVMVVVVVVSGEAQNGGARGGGALARGLALVLVRRGNLVNAGLLLRDDGQEEARVEGGRVLVLQLAARPLLPARLSLGPAPRRLVLALHRGRLASAADRRRCAAVRGRGELAQAENCARKFDGRLSCSWIYAQVDWK